MNCLLIMPYSALPESRSSVAIGMAYISAAMKRVDGLRVLNLNLNLSNSPASSQAGEITDILKQEKIDAVFSGGLWPDFNSLDLIFKTVKAHDPRIITVTGGPIISGDPEAALEALEAADYGIIGEGEKTIVELCLALMERRSTADVNGLIFKADGRWRLTPPRTPILDWAEIPWPDYEGFGLSRLQEKYGGTSIPPLIPIAASRGCPFRCTFCHNSQGKVYRQRPLDDFIAELRHWVSKYGTKIPITVIDDLLAESKPRLKAFCEAIKGFGLKSLSVSLRVPQVDEETVAWLKEIGVSQVAMGLESANDEVLKSMKKQITFEQTERALKIVLEAGLLPQGIFIFGDPKETWATAMETLNWWRANTQYTNISLCFILLYPGTALYQKAVAEGHIADPVAYLKNGYPLVNVSSLSEAEFQALGVEIHEQFVQRGLDPAFHCHEMVVIHDFETMTKTVSGYCRRCGARLEMGMGLSRTLFICPSCLVGHYLPNFNMYKVDRERVNENLGRLLKKYGRVTFWGIGHYFRQFVTPEMADQPGLRLVDRTFGRTFGAKAVESVESLAGQDPGVIINSVLWPSTMYEEISAMAAERFEPARVVSLYALQYSDFH